MQKLRHQKFIVVASVFLALFGFFSWKAWRAPSKAMLSMPGLYHEYEHMLSNPEVSTVRRVLLILRNQGAPEGLSESMKRVDDHSPEMRKVIAEVLGGYPFVGKSAFALETLVQDPNEAVRLSAIEAISQKSELARGVFLEKRLKSATLSDEEKNAYQFGLYRVAKDPGERKRRFDQFMLLLKPDSDLPVYAINTLTSIAPQDPRVINAFKIRLEKIQSAPLNSDQTRSMVLMYRHLAFYSPASIRGEFLKFVERSEVSIQEIAVTTAPLVCAPDRWRVLKMILNSHQMSDELKLLSFSAVEQLGGRNARSISEMLLDHPIFPELKTKAERMIKHPVPKGRAGELANKDRCEIPKSVGARPSPRTIKK